MNAAEREAIVAEERAKVAANRQAADAYVLDLQTRARAQGRTIAAEEFEELRAVGARRGDLGLMRVAGDAALAGAPTATPAPAASAPRVAPSRRKVTAAEVDRAIGAWLDAQDADLPAAPTVGARAAAPPTRGPRSLVHLLGRVFDTPHLIVPDKARVIVEVLDAHMRGIAPRLEREEAEEGERRAYRVTASGVAVLPIVGTLVNKAGSMDALSGLVSYQQLGQDLERALADPSVRGVLLDVDSPGGECGGCFELVEKVVAARASVPIYAVANPMAASGGYALAAAASKVYAPAVSYVGSIGVYSMHLDQSKYDAARGLAYTYIFAGARKVDGNPHAPMGAAERAATQERIDALYAIFVDSVARNRGMKPAAVRATEAAVLLGEQAKKAGLIDVVGGVDRALADLEREVATGGGRRW